MKDIIQQLRNRASQKGKTIVLPEAEDPRVLKAADFLSRANTCSVILIGNENEIRKKSKEENIQLSESIVFASLQMLDNPDPIIENLFECRKHKGISREEVMHQLENSLYLAAGLVATGKADGAVAGSVAPTADVIRAAIHSIGLREGTNIVSSTFLMALSDGKVLTYADCGVVPYPNEKQLADIAIGSSRTHHLLTQEKPVVAMLSFSTKGSAKHERTDLVVNALELARKKAPDLQIDGEFQFDAAFIPEVAKRKAPESTVAGNANVFIYPNLDAGNIAYKITERLAGAVATGPILQGLSKPMMDLSRGCTWQDIVNAACVATLMSE